jgi:AraC family transcriptional regulator
MNNPYQQRLKKVLQYIDTTLDQKLSIEQLSAVAAFSKFHFHRQFSAAFGISVFSYVQLCRLKRAAHHLAFRPAMSVIQIAIAHGYDEPESFSRAFKRHTGQTPTEFRKSPRWEVWNTLQLNYRELRRQHMPMNYDVTQVRLVDFPAMPIAAREHRGNPALIGNTIREFIDWRKQHQLSPKRYATFNILHTHPDEVAAADFHFDIATSVKSDFSTTDAHIVLKQIPAGQCAVLRHVGSDDQLEQSIQFLYEQWLPQSGKELRDYPLFLQRHNFYPDVAESEIILDLFLPLK